MEWIDFGYYTLMNEDYRGQWHPVVKEPLSAKNFRSMFLDDNMPWKKENLLVSKKSKESSCQVTTDSRNLFCDCSSAAGSLFIHSCVRPPVLNTTMDVDNRRSTEICYIIFLPEFIQLDILQFYIMQTYKPPTCNEYHDKMVEVFGNFKGGKALILCKGFECERILIGK
jgi:hypothetical protein